MITIKRTTALDEPIAAETFTGGLFAHESAAHTFAITCTRDGADVALTGSITGYFRRCADGVTVPLTGSITGGGARVTLPAACYATPGRFYLTILHTSGSVTTAIYSAVGDMRQG